MTVRLRNIVSGVFVGVSDEKAERLGAEWEPAETVPRSESPDNSWKVGELREYAEANDIDLGEATKKADILAVFNS